MWRASCHGCLFAFLAILPTRPLSIELALIRGEINWRERVAAAWFGPRGVASAVFSLLVVEAGLPRAGDLFHLATLVIVASIVAHSSTGVVIARWLQHARLAGTAAEGKEACRMRKVVTDP